MKHSSLLTVSIICFLGAATAAAGADPCTSDAAPAVAPGDEACATVSSLHNPCCPWVEGGHCTILDARSSCNSYENKTGVYSKECAAYLERCAEATQPWMTTAVEAMHDFIAKNTDFIPQGMDASLVDQKAKDIVDGPWTAFNTTYGKCMSAGFATGTYIGIYNCESAFEKKVLNHSGCTLFEQAYGANKYAGTVRNFQANKTCPSPIGLENEDEDCAFNLFPDKKNETFVYAFNTKCPFEVTTRPWYETAESDTNHGKQPLFLAPYPNYTTGHPVFGWTQGVFDGTQIQAAALVLEYVADDPAYLEYVVSCVAASATPGDGTKSPAGQ